MTTIDNAAGREWLQPLVLIVDDDEDSRELLAVLLRSVAFRVTEAASVTQAFAEALRARPAAIVTDLVFPGFDGLELIRQLKADTRTQSIPVIVLTGWPGQALQDEAKSAGCSVVLSKPFEPEHVLWHLQQVLRPQTQET